MGRRRPGVRRPGAATTQEAASGTTWLEARLSEEGVDRGTLISVFKEMAHVMKCDLASSIRCNVIWRTELTEVPVDER